MLQFESTEPKGEVKPGGASDELMERDPFNEIRLREVAGLQLVHEGVRMPKLDCDGSAHAPAGILKV